MKLPDGWRFRVDWRGKVLLQRQYRTLGGYPGDWIYRWRDATSTDLTAFFKEVYNA